MKKANSNNANRRLKPGTMVVAKTDGESGTVAQVCTYRRNGIDAWSYLVDTKDGQEIWEAGELFVPECESNDKKLRTFIDDNQGLTYGRTAARKNAAMWEELHREALVTLHRRGGGWIIRVEVID